MIVGGASGSGKTEWVCNFIENCDALIKPQPQHILYCYGVHNSNVLRLQDMGVETYFGLPIEQMIRQRQKPMLLILDDLMMEAKSDFLDLLFTRGSHHWGVSILFITQNMFEKSMKTARNNAHYLVLLRNPSGQLQIRNLGTQLFPRNLTYFMESYKNATSANYGYLVVDMHPSSSELMRLRTRIFPDDKGPVLFTPKNS
ncbi:Protein Y57G11C.18 [Aphelenchoides avenae]|nr:Protein Y57G11C.18 [Aphelenchus avenae]